MVNAPSDRYEQEADAMAERVMRMPESKPQPLKPTATGLIARSIQRKCAACEAEEEKKKKSGLLMRKAEGNAGGFAASPALVSQLNATKGGGSPLPEGTRSFMENAFSSDFSGVRVHTGGQAAEMSRSIQAKAFTYGSDIYFNSGQFAPESGEGKRLLAHELGHVVQGGWGSNRILLKKESDGNINPGKNHGKLMLDINNKFSQKLQFFLDVTSENNNRLSVGTYFNHITKFFPSENTETDSLLIVNRIFEFDLVDVSPYEHLKGVIEVESRAEINGVSEHPKLLFDILNKPVVNAYHKIKKARITNLTSRFTSRKSTRDWGLESLDIYPNIIDFDLVVQIIRKRRTYTELIERILPGGTLESSVKSDKFLSFSNSNKDKINVIKGLIQRIIGIDDLEDTVLYWETEVSKLISKINKYGQDVIHRKIPDFSVLNKAEEFVNLLTQFEGHLRRNNYMAHANRVHWLLIELNNAYRKAKDAKPLPEKKWYSYLFDTISFASKIVIVVLGSIAHFLHGFALGIYSCLLDIVKQAWDIITLEIFKNVYDIVKSFIQIFENEGFDGIWRIVKEIFKGIYADFKKEWNENPVKLIGKIVGMIICEVVIAIATFGVGNIIKASLKSIKILNKVPILMKLADKLLPGSSSHKGVRSVGSPDTAHDSDVNLQHRDPDVVQNNDPDLIPNTGNRAIRNPDKVAEIREELDEEIQGLSDELNDELIDDLYEAYGQSIFDHIGTIGDLWSRNPSDARRLAGDFFETAHDLRHIEGIDEILEDYFVGSPTSLKGSEFELRWVQSHASQVRAVAIPRASTQWNIKKGADVFLNNGTVVDLKNYNFTFEIYSSRPDRTVRKLIDQLEKRFQEGYREFRVIFSSDAGPIPDSLEIELRRGFQDFAESKRIDPRLVTFGSWP
ncbi:MAG: hypothetical protein KIPDCIKN_00453 [Haliscomenobacter sp.]|nr:hypothetical protein [Haliscomenobacter sp.]